MSVGGSSNKSTSSRALVENSPSSLDFQETVTGTYDIMKSIGQSPIVAKRNTRVHFKSLQGALINEALRLAEGDYASTDDIDCAVRDGLGLRWSFMGPFETIDLNAPGGLAIMQHVTVKCIVKCQSLKALR